jgi:C_GCAxxG_C_C family probable redox protein
MKTVRDEAVKKAREMVRYNMEHYGSCAQSTLLALQDTFGLQDESVLRASTGMTGGVGGMGDACGSLLGAVMFLGQVLGRDRTQVADEEKLGAMMVRVGRLYKWYEKTFGSAGCYDICKSFGGGTFYDRNVPWQKELLEEEGIHEKCTVLAEETVVWVIDNLWDDIVLKQAGKTA